MNYLWQLCAQTIDFPMKYEIIDILPVLEPCAAAGAPQPAAITGGCAGSSCCGASAGEPLQVQVSISTDQHFPEDAARAAAREMDAQAYLAAVQSAEGLATKGETPLGRQQTQDRHDEEDDDFSWDDHISGAGLFDESDRNRQSQGLKDVEDMKSLEEEVQRAQEHWRQQLEAERMARADGESAEFAEHVRQQAALRAERDALRAADARRALEASRQEQELATFMAEHKFSTINGPKKSMLSKTYPLHCAAELGKDQVVEILLQAGADPTLRDSKGKTAADVAQRRNAKGSHAAVVRRLGGA